MKKILVTGSNSYIGICFGEWLENYGDNYLIDTLSVKDQSWINEDFSNYDVILHVAGIAHIKEKKKNHSLYYNVNSDLVYKIAKKAKFEGVRQFVFLSSMSVYGKNAGIINKDTIPAPNSIYGKSKFQAERLIVPLADKFFKVAILRPPMVYGNGCKGNYPKLVSLANKLPLFPFINNKRSMIYVDHLSEFIRLIINNCDGGFFYPQNKEYVCTSEMIKFLLEAHEKKIRMTKIFNRIIRLLKMDTFVKLFGDLTYDKEMSEYRGEYCIYNFKETVYLTEGRRSK
ncbi:NAD-dependent epimerase/dehydratase family protein [Paenibacillus sp. BAC0078]